MRFNIRIDDIWRVAVLLAGATPQNSYVFLGDDGMHFRFGFGFNRTIAYDQVAAVFPRSWPLLYGVGVRSNLRGVIGLTGSYHDVVEVRMRQRIGNWAGVFPCDRIAVSLEEPELFIEELSARTGLAEPPDINALSKPTRRPTKPSAVSRPSTAGRQRTAKGAAPKATAAKPASTSAKSNGSKSVASAKGAAPKRAARKAAPSQTAVRARRPRSS